MKSMKSILTSIKNLLILKNLREKRSGKEKTKTLYTPYGASELKKNYRKYLIKFSRNKLLLYISFRLFRLPGVY
jgi:hypothetical protein